MLLFFIITSGIIRMIKGAMRRTPKTRKSTEFARFLLALIVPLPN
jgi:hypothetical protein